MTRGLSCLLLVLLAANTRAGETTRAVSFHSIYEDNRRLGRPNYITADYLFTVWGQLMENAVGAAEEKLAPEFTGLIAGLLASQSASTPAARANRDFLAVILALARDRADAEGAFSSEKAGAELAAVRAANRIADSSLFPEKIDYSQFAPRGRYTRTAEAGAYFRALKYASAPLFAIRASQATGITEEQADLLTAQAQSLVAALYANAALRAKYESLDRKLGWLFGPADDLTPAQYARVLQLSPQAARARLLALRQRPAILSGIVDRSRLEHGVSPEDVLSGFRLIPQRFSPDAAALQQLVAPHAGVFTGKGEPFTAGTINGQTVRAFPRFLDLLAAGGSVAAAKQLAGDGDAGYEKFTPALATARKRLATPGTMSFELSGVMRSLNGPRQSSTAQGLWIWQRHASVLYVKQSTTAVDKGFRSDPARSFAYLEPQPRAYATLANVVLHAAGQLDSSVLREFAAVLRRCATIARREQSGAMPAGSDADFLNSLDLVFEEFGIDADSPIVIDVHTEPNSGLVVEEGVEGATVKTQEINHATAAGGVFRIREFKQPLSDRLTDERWRQMLQ